MSTAEPPNDRVVGWDVGGAHVKAALVEAGRVRDVAQVACPLWQGVDHLDRAVRQLFERWPHSATARHAVTMTGEMADVFVHREAGVRTIASHLARVLGRDVALYAGRDGWIRADEAAEHWHAVASANWHATASVVAQRIDDALLVDVGSTTTDLIPVIDGRVAAHGYDDAARLESGELAYVGVVRTPLCALASRVRFDGRLYAVMKEWFATTADVFRLTGELDAAHDQQPAADNGAKDPRATHARLARMIGRDARDAQDEAWLEFAHTWRAIVLSDIRESIQRIASEVPLRTDAIVVGAGCGCLLARELARQFDLRFRDFSDIVAVDDGCRGWATVCAPCVSVALLRAEQLGGVAA